MRNSDIGLWLGSPSTRCAGHVLHLSHPIVLLKLAKIRNTHTGNPPVFPKTEICWEELLLQLTKKVRNPALPSLSKGWSRCKCFPFTNQPIITSIPTLGSWGTGSMSAFVPCMSPAFSKHLATNGLKRVLCTDYLSALIFTLSGWQCSGYSPYTCPLLDWKAAKDAISKFNIRSYPRLIKFYSSFIACLSESLNFPLFLLIHIIKTLF